MGSRFGPRSQLATSTVIFLVVTTQWWGEGAMDSSIETWEVAEYPAMPRTAPHDRELSGPKCE